MAKKKQTRKNANTKTGKKADTKKRSKIKGIPTKRNRQGKTGGKNPIAKNPLADSKKSKSKKVRKSKQINSSKSKAYYSASTDTNTVVYYFSKGLAENKKVADLNAWDGEPLRPYITKNRVKKYKDGYKFSVTKLPTDLTKGFLYPDGVWIKLVKRKPRGKESFYSSVLSPLNFLPDSVKKVKGFAAGVLEKYYADFIGSIKDNETVKESKAKKRNKYKLKGSDPDDMEGKPLKVDAVIFQFIY